MVDYWGKPALGDPATYQDFLLFVTPTRCLEDSKTKHIYKYH